MHRIFPAVFICVHLWPNSFSIHQAASVFAEAPHQEAAEEGNWPQMNTDKHAPSFPICVHLCSSVANCLSSAAS
jgi:hypothetical protein